MKITRILTFAAIAAVLFSCEQLPIDNESPAGFSIDKTSLEIPGTGGEVSIEITAPAPWSADCTAAQWLSVDPASGNSGTTTVKVTAAPNPSKEEDRSGKIIIKYDEVSFSVKVTQGKSLEEAVFSIDKKSFDVPAAGGEFEFTVISDTQEYDITLVEDWITVVSRQGDRHTGEVIRLAASGNMYEARTGVVSVCTKDGSCVPVMVNQEGWPRFVHQNIGYRFTATWCGYCPYMDEAFHKVAQDPANRFGFITFHASSGYPLYLGASATLANYYKVEGYPTGVLNGWKEINNYTDTDYNASNIAGFIKDFEEAFPCIAGISVNTSVDGSTLSAEATVTAFPGDYLVSAFVLESGIVEAQTFYPTTGGSKKLSDFVHDNVARSVLSTSAKGDSFTVGTEPVTLSWSKEISSAWVPENLSVAVVLMRPYGDLADKKDKKAYPKNYVVNSVIVPAGSSKEMEYAQ